MHKPLAISLTAVGAVLLATTVLVARSDGDDTAAPRQRPTASDATTTSTGPTTTSSTTSTSVAPTTTSTTTTTTAPVVRAEPATPPARPPSSGGCDPAAVRQAIDGSGGVASGLAYEITYLACADGYGWATIVGDLGDGATVLLRGAGSDVEMLNLGSSVCPTDSMPASVATRLAPPGSVWDCP